MDLGAGAEGFETANTILSGVHANGSLAVAAGSVPGLFENQPSELPPNTFVRKPICHKGDRIWYNLGKYNTGGSVKKFTLILSVLFWWLLGACSAPGAVPTGEVTADRATRATLDPITDHAGRSPSPPSCIPNPPRPTPSDEDLAVLPRIQIAIGSRVRKMLPITIIEYADFQCPYCSVASQNFQSLLEKYPDDVRVVYRHFPLASIHDKAIPAARAAEAAGLAE